jgi:hypothetical protein
MLNNTVGAWHMIRVKLIPLSQAMPGMELNRDVCNSLGQVLLKAGNVLSTTSISSLNQKNIGHVSVLQADERSEEELAAERISVTNRINSLFVNVPQDGTMGALRQMILDYRLEKLSS